jgi:hypothetical protein
MANKRRLNITELDFDQIKSNLKAYLQADPNFTDYDFEGSVLTSVLDVLAYNTFYNAFNANAVINEVFLDTAQLRNNVVSHAKMLGYVPRSKTSAFTFLNVNVINPVGAPTSLTMDRGTRFTTLVDGTIYQFVNLEASTITPVSGVYEFKAVKVNQGELKSILYVVDSSNDRQTFQIQEENVDISSILVKVRDTYDNSAYDVYSRNSNVTNITGTSKVYFIQEGLDGRYEIYFGDDIFGKRLLPGNVVEIEYLVTDAELANGASSFALSDTIQGNTSVSISSVDALGTSANSAGGGGDRESIDSIKYNAPLTFLSQNRVVTADDYKATILNNYSNVETITAWGGEENEPPEYGKVYISIKPKDAEALTVVQKQFIIDSILRTKNVVSITPEIVDPTYTYVTLDVYFKYDPNLTDKTSGELKDSVIGIINTYNNEDLKRFDGVFRYSKLTRNIDTSDPSILNSVIKVNTEKRFIPTLNAIARYEVEFSSPLYASHTSEAIIDTDEFTIDGVAVKIRNYPDSYADGLYKLKTYRTIGEDEVIVNPDVGYVDVTNGIVVLNGVNITAYDTVKGFVSIYGKPNSFDIAPKRNQLVIINMSQTNVTPEIDTIATGGTIAGIGYTVIARH